MAPSDTAALTPHLGATVLRELEARTAQAGRDQVEVVAPFTLEVIGRVPQAGNDDVAEAAARARAAQPAWESLGAEDRARILLRFHDILLDHLDEVTDLIQLEGGKSRLDAWREVVDVIGVTRYIANVTPRATRRRRHQGAMPVFTKTYEYRHPKGLVGFISPWNYPFILAISDAIAALATGNAALIKPDEKTPFCALLGARLLEEAGVPGDVLQILTGAGAPIGDAIVDAVDYVMFTGSTEVGRSIAAMAGRRLIGCSMELGGKNAAIVLPDADMARTVRQLASASFANAGQTCVAMERIYVHESIREELTRRLAEHSGALPVTAGFDFSSEVSSMIDQAHLDRVHAHVEDAVANGATLLTGGKPRPDVGPLFYAPTVLTDVTEEMRLCREETFGPVTSIYGYTDLAEAVARANDSEFGLHFSLWTRDTARALDIATRLEAGSVTINDGLVASWGSHEAPMGGMKASGLGRRHGLDGILKFTEPQTVATQRLVPAYSPFGGITPERYTRLVEFLTTVFKRLPFYK
jgi:succinate-semialdehyde dehydrogenase / glutarate-semialdehyde dehydrogenase